MSAQRRFFGWGGWLAALAMVTVGCDSWEEPVGPDSATTVPSAAFARLGRARVTLCHRTGGSGGYVSITVADRAVAAHLGHGDAVVGDPVPGQPGMELDSGCEPVVSRRVTTVTGTWNGTSFLFSGLFTVGSTGPVDATATVSATDPTWPLRLVLLGYNPQAQNPPGTCSTYWLPTPLDVGPTMSPPTVSAHWDEVPPGTYCLNVASAVPVPPYPPSYSWTATITYP